MLEPRRLLAATYYVSATGDDAHDGRSIATAWRTIAKVNAHDFGPGDKVLFEGAKTFSAVGSTGSELIYNGSFESGLTGWSDTFGSAASNATASGTSVHSGSKAIKLSGAGAAIRAQDVTAKVKPNQTYRLACWTRTTSPGSGDRRAGITFYKNGKQVETIYRGFRAGAWAQTTWELVSPRAFDQAKLWISRKGDSSTFYVDDVSLKSIPNGVIFDDLDSGLASSPLTIASYGTGKATIDARDGIGLWGGNVSGISIQNLVFKGTWNATDGTGNNAGVGIELVNTRSDNSKLGFATIEKCIVQGFKWAGVRVGGWAAKSGFKTVLITDTTARYNGDVGILVRGEFDRASTAYANEKVYIARCFAYGNSGIPDKGGNSGSGIQLADTLYGTVERSVAHDNGRLNKWSEGGPVGIWAYDSSKITLQYNESYSNHTGSMKDGGGFDLDGGVTRSVIQNNYSHDNDGAGYLLCQFSGARAWGKNIVRYNISQNDAHKNSYGAITLTGGPGPTQLVVEHNTIYVKSASSGTPSGIRVRYAQSSVLLRNNIVCTSGGVSAVNVESAGASAAFKHNNYWTSGSGSNAPPAGQMSLDPMLAAPGGAPTLNDAYKLNTLTHYALKAGSPMTDAATPLTSPFTGYTAAVYDFFGRVLPGSKRDIGADEL
jgi:hypothetical protein